MSIDTTPFDLVDHSKNPDVLSELADSPLPGIRYRVAGNPHTPRHIMAKLAQDPDSNVRWRLAYNYWTPPDILTAVADSCMSLPDLCMSSEKPIRRRLIDNPNTPEPVKIWLRNDGYAGLPLREFLEQLE